MKFHTGDWLKDPKLSMCDPATRGIWIDALCAMHEDGRSGTLTGSLAQIARVLRCTESALHSALNDLTSTGAASVDERNGIVTLVNRRMQREANARELNQIRQERFREKHQCNDPTTPMSLLGSISDSLYLFKEFYKEYPRKENPKKAKEAFVKAGITEEMMPGIIEWLNEAKQSEQWQDKTKIPHPTTFLNQRRWEGDPPPKKQSNLPDYSGIHFGDEEEEF